MSASVPEAVRFLLHEGVGFRELQDTLWRSRRSTLLIMLVPVFVAVAAGITLPRWYASGATLTVETGTPLPAGSSVLGLASQLGLASGTASTSPQFYADLLTSRLLFERILTARFPIGMQGEQEPLESFWNKGRPVDARAHARSLEKLRNHFSASANPRTGVIGFTVEGPTSPVAKLMADTALAALNDLVVSIRRRHASAERQFLEDRWRALRDSLSAHEDVLRTFYERNRQITSPQLQFEELRLRREIDRVQTIYAQLGAQLEQARIQEVRDVPAISVIDPPIAAIRKSAPRLRLLVFTGALVGAVLALILALMQTAIAHLRERGRALSRHASPERV